MEPETRSFDQLFVDYYGHVYRTLYRILGDAQESEDLVQEVFLRFHEVQEDVDPLRLRAWLTQVAINTALNNLRSRKRREARHQAISDTRKEEVSTHPERTLAIRRILFEQLTPQQAHLLMLYAAGLRYDEIAPIMEVQTSSLSQLLLRAKRAFAQAYETERAHS